MNELIWTELLCNVCGTVVVVQVCVGVSIVTSQADVLDVRSHEGTRLAFLVLTEGRMRQWKGAVTSPYARRVFRTASYSSSSLCALPVSCSLSYSYIHMLQLPVVCCIFIVQ